MVKRLDNTYDAKSPRFNRAPNNNYNLWRFRVEAVLECREMKGALDSDNVDQSVDRQASAIIIAGLGNNPGRVVQD